MISKSIKKRINYIIYLMKLMKINNQIRKKMNNNIKFNKLEFLDKNNNERNKRNYIFIFH